MSQLSANEFRALFPAVDRLVWFDTPGSSPGMTPVVDAVRDQLAEWSSGEFDWTDWDLESERSRVAFAELLGVSDGNAATINSAGDGVATIAASIDPGAVVVSDLEYQSLLLPFEAQAERGVSLRRVAASDGVTRTERLIAAIDGGCSLVAASGCLSLNGSRLDLVELGSACRASGVPLLLDLTQSLGVLDSDLSLVRPDYVVAHGYKWLCTPRGAAWLWATDASWSALKHHAPSWRNRSRPFDYFGGSLVDGVDAVRRADGSLTWMAWRGANAALRVINSLDRSDVERHVFALRSQWEDGAAQLGFVKAARELASHISVMYGPKIDDQVLRRHGVRMLASGSRVRAGFHYFNTSSDVQRGLEALTAATR